MDEVSGALIAIALVLCGVFIPTSFIPGISGQFYQQFALTIVSAAVISAFVSLTLSPALAAIVLQPKHESEPRPGVLGWPARFARGFNRGFERRRRALRQVHRPRGPGAGAGRHRLCLPDRAGRLALHRDADRLHPGAGPGLSDRGHPVAAGRLAAADDRDHDPGDENRAGQQGDRGDRRLCRPGRRDLLHRAQCRRHVHPAETPCRPC